MKVKKEIYIAGPQGEAVYAGNQCYTTKDGVELTESVRHEASDGKTYYASKIYRRYSKDNGRTWIIQEPIYCKDPNNLDGYHQYPSKYFMDTDNALLLSTFTDYIEDTKEAQFSSRSTSALTRRMHYVISRDGGKTWEPSKQIIHTGSEYNEKHWMPGITYGKSGGVGDGPFVKLDDGTIILGFTITQLLDEGARQVGFLRARWKKDLSGLDWEAGEYLRVPSDKASCGCCEPDLICLGGQRLFTTMRCQGKEELGIYSSRYCSLSEDGGKTWSKPEILCYEDGSPVYVPASYAGFLKHPKTGKVYWIANILDKPIYGQTPRYPLTIAELNTEKLCIIKDSVKAIQDLPEGAPKDRRYTNFGYYVDRETGEFVLTLPEQPKISWDNLTSDCVRYTINL